MMIKWWWARWMVAEEGRWVGWSVQIGRYGERWRWTWWRIAEEVMWVGCSVWIGRYGERWRWTWADDRCKTMTMRQSFESLMFGVGN
jgi:hypothetical protein